MENNNLYKNFFCLDHNPLVKHKLTILRNKNTPSKDFREIIEEITYIVAIEALKNLKFSDKVVQTPLAKYNGIKLNDAVLIPIIRAGIIMVNPLQKLLPNSKVGFIGLARDKTSLTPKQYYKNFPVIEKDNTALILDPMLATGNTIAYTIELLKEQGVTDIIVIGILSAKKALDTIFKAHPQCLIYSAGYDAELDKDGYITPGLGDAGDRIFNT
jgi:uracil phosphoribosyltransferase